MSGSDPTLEFTLIQRLALAYAPASGRAALELLLAFDRRLAEIVRSSREPVLAQLRLAWWREQLLMTDPAPAASDPLILSLRAWPGSRVALAGLANGWEGMTGPAPLPASAFIVLAEARASAFAYLIKGQPAESEALRMGRNWALADIAAHLSDPRERELVRALADRQDWRQARLPRALRPLAVLHGLAARASWGDNPQSELTFGRFVAAMRIGLLGR